MADDKPIIKATTPNSEKYDTKIDIYTNNPREEHESIHIAINSDDKSAHIIDTTNGSTEHSDVKCFLTTACMRHYYSNFKDNCYELKMLRWFRDRFVTEDDIKHYYEIASIIVEAINNEKESEIIYSYIYHDIIEYCIVQIETKNFEEAYFRYKNCILAFEEKFARLFLEKKLVNVLKLSR